MRVGRGLLIARVLRRGLRRDSVLDLGTRDRVKGRYLPVTSENSDDLPLKANRQKGVAPSINLSQADVLSPENKVSGKSKSQILYDSVDYVNPLQGLVDAEDVEEAFRVSYVDFQRDFMEELSEKLDLHFSNITKQVSEMQVNIANLQQQQATLLISLRSIESLKQEIQELKSKHHLEVSNTKLQSKDDSPLPLTNTQSGPSLSRASNRQLDMNVSLRYASETEDSKIFPETSLMSNSEPLNKTPSPRRWADICDDSTSSTGWAIAAASVAVKTPSYSNKSSGLNLVISGDVPKGSVASIKRELISRFNSALAPTFRGLDRDLTIDDISHVLVDTKSIRIRLSSLEAKNVIFENKKLLTGSSVSLSEEERTCSMETNPHDWKMYISPQLTAQDLKNQKVIVKAFHSLQLKGEGTSFKIFPQGYSIKIVTPDGKKFFYPFDCKHSPKHFLQLKGVRCKD